MNKCPKCNGRGCQFAPFVGLSMTCGACEGTGKVTDGQLFAIERGGAYREQRIAGGEGLRQHAERIGVKPAGLSYFEQGLREFPTASESQ